MRDELPGDPAHQWKENDDFYANSPERQWQEDDDAPSFGTVNEAENDG